MMNLHVQDLLNDFEYEVRQGNYKKMEYRVWRDLNAQRSSPVSIKVSGALYSPDTISDTEIILMVNGQEYIFDAWDCSFGEFLNEFMAIELKMDSCGFDALSAATASASKSTSELLSSIQDNYSSVYYNRDDWSTATSISNNFYEKQPTVEITEQGLKVKGQYVEEIIDEVTGNSIQIRKEKDNMDLIKNFDFGSCANDNVKVSMYGIAVKNANGTWVSYNPKTGDVMDVDILNFDGKYLYKMPVALKDVKSGDVVIHNRKPMFVSKVEGGKILAIDPAAGEEKVIMLTKNMFGFDFATKVINLFEGFTGGVSADAPFGNMFPLMMLADNKNNDMLPFMLMMNGSKMDMSNPMMMYFLMKDNKGDNDMLPFLLMSNFSGNCNCHCDCDCDREG